MQLRLTLLFCLVIGWLSAQETTYFTEAYHDYKEGITLMERGQFGAAQANFMRVITALRPANEAEAEVLLAKAELEYARAAVQLGQTNGEKLILDFIRRHRPNPIAGQALVEMANYYFNAKEYDKAIEYYGKAPAAGMSEEQKAETRFRKGYSYFVQKKFTQARNSFNSIKDIKGEYYYPTNYYLGLTEFFDGNYDAAIRSFRIVEKTKRYRSHIPYYIAQIYFAEGRYDELISYAEPRLQDRSTKKAKEISQLVGQAYFERKDYARAMPYLTYYAERSSKLREEEWYQLGYTAYETADYQQAAKAFKEISNEDTKLGQYAAYYLGDSYLRNGEAQNARSAYAQARRLNFDPVIKEEALWNYAKLSYELGQPRDAITTLQSIPPSSRYYTEAQSLIGEIFLNYRDFQQAINVLSAIENKTPQLRESYQKVTYLRGLQLLQENKLEEAKNLFQLSIQDAIDIKTRALATYWLADIAHREEQYNLSIRLTSEYMTVARTLTNLPDESSVFAANYLQGYNYLKQKNYTAAQGYFKEAIEGIKRNRSYIGSDALKNNILGDATLRAGDCLFKRNQYDQAIVYYDEAVSRRYSGYIYALYQKALIEGLRGRTAEKILALERIAQNHSQSPYADDALFQLGRTYQEIGQLSKAVQPLNRLIRDYRQTSDLINQSLLSLGLVYYNLGQYEKAINYYKQIFSNNPTPGEANLALAALEEIYVEDLVRADDYFAFLETIPGYQAETFSRDSINFRAAEVQFENGNYDRAINAYSEYLRKFPNGRYTVVAHYHRGESNAVQSRYNEAFQDYEWVVQRGQSRYYLKALEKAAIIAYNHAQDFSKAYQLYVALEQSAMNEDQRFEAQLGAMRAAYRSNRTAAVEEQARKVATNPGANQQQKATASFYLGKIAFDRNDLDLAMSHLETVIQNSDNEQTAEARYLRAEIYYKKRDLAKAQELLIQNNRDNSAYPYWVAKSVILLSDVLAERGDLFNGRAALEALLDNYNEDPELVQIAQQKLDRINRQIESGSRLAPGSDPNRLELDEGN